MARKVGVDVARVEDPGFNTEAPVTHVRLQMIIRLICTNNNTRLIAAYGGPSARKTGPRTQNKVPVFFQYTTGMLGFKGATRSSIYAAENLFNRFSARLNASKLSSHSFILLVKGLGPARNYILRKLAQLKITQVKDITTYPHNGCRKKKSLRK